MPTKFPVCTQNGVHVLHDIHKNETNSTVVDLHIDTDIDVTSTYDRFMKVIYITIGVSCTLCCLSIPLSIVIGFSIRKKEK